MHVTACCWPSQDKDPEVELAKVTLLYQELLYSVQSKYPGESRHQTALRYIRSAEQGSSMAQEE